MTCVRSRRLAGLACAFLLALAALGCGEGGPPMGDVEGVVTVDGTPAAEGSVTFVPTDNKLAPAGGDIKDGKYALRVPAGPCKVQLRVHRKTGERKLYPKDPNSPTVGTFENALPEKYNDDSKLTHDVPPGKSVKNWDVESKSAKKGK